MESINTKLYSHQISTFGLEDMIKISKLRVLVSGLRGVGAESAKNLILTGVNSVVLHDDNIVSLTDLGSNFCLNEQDIGIKTRADASLNKLQEISYGVKVSVHKGELLPSFLLSFDVIVLTETNLAKINSQFLLFLFFFFF